MSRLLVFCLLLVISSITNAQISKEKKLEQLKSRNDIKVTEIKKDLLRLEYPDGKVLIKNIADYTRQTINNLLPTSYSLNYDSTIIDLTTIDTTLYYQKYSYGLKYLYIIGNLNSMDLENFSGQILNPLPFMNLMNTVVLILIINMILSL